MTKQEIIEKLKQDRAAGLTYKWLAAQMGINTQAIYNYVRRGTTKSQIHPILEEYYTKRGE